MSGSAYPYVTAPLSQALCKGVFGLSYAKARLLLGISNVGFWVVVSVVILANSVTPQGRLFLADYSAVQVVLLSLGVYMGASAFFDYLGGYLLPTRYQKITLSVGQCLVGWVKGVWVQGLCMGACSIALIYGFTVFQSLPVRLVCVALLQVLFAVFQPVIARGVGRFKLAPSNNNGGQKIWYSYDPGFTGGVSMMGDVILPGHWQQAFKPPQLAWLIARRRLLKASGMHWAGIAGAILFNTLGVGVTLGWGQLDFSVPSQWLVLVSGITLWSFLGVLVLPPVSQYAALCLDAKTTSTSVESATISATDTGFDPTVFYSLDALQDNEPERSRWIQRIFHPLPSVAQRLYNHQSGQQPVWGLWHVARQALFLSWPLFGLLSRGVHCNIGRPDLWVFLPCEG